MLPDFPGSTLGNTVAIAHWEGIMADETAELKQVATQLLAGMLANPHIYASASDEEVRGQREQALITVAIDIAASLIEKVERRNSHST